MRRTLLLPALSLLLAVPVSGQEPIDTALVARLREEGLKNSQAMKTLRQLLDGFGPRLTASPSYKAAADWAVKQLVAWGLDGARLEGWDFGHPGWTNERCSVHALEPYLAPLHVEVQSWTPSTAGAVKGAVVGLAFPEEPLAEELEKALKDLEGKVKGRVVFVGQPKTVAVLPTAFPARAEDAALVRRFDPSQPPAPPRFPGDRGAPKRAGAMRANDVAKRVDEFLVAQGALARVNDAGMRNGMIRAFQNRTYDLAKAVPTVVMRNEDYGRLWRQMEDGKKAVLELDITNRLHPGSRQAYNVVAELAGTGKPEEVVLLGAHFDSWHTATGATDNGASAVVMMEALRLLKAAGAKPARTIRVVLYDAEEHGLLGSQAYVKTHFGSVEAPTPAFGKLSAAFNMDNGAGKIRGLSVFGPPEAGGVLRELLAPYKDLGVVGAIHSSYRPANGGTDSHSFSFAGLPVVNLVQDGMEYFDYTWHTSVDTLERISAEDVARTATVMASVAYHLANREQLLPRFTQASLPPVAAPAPAPVEKKN